MVLGTGGWGWGGDVNAEGGAGTYTITEHTTDARCHGLSHGVGSLHFFQNKQQRAV